MQVNDIVIIKDDKVARNQWQLGRITEVYIDQDNHVRKVKVAVSSRELDNKGKRKGELTILERPVYKLVLLLENSNQS